MANPYNHKDFVCSPTSDGIFTVLAVMVFKCISHCEALAYSTLTACGQNVDFIADWADANKEEKHFLTVFQLNCVELHQTQQQFWLVQNLNLTRLQLPAAWVKQLQPPHTLQIWGDGLHFSSCRWFGELGASAVEEISYWHADQTHCRVTADFPAQNWSGFTNRSRANKKCAVFSTSAYWLKYIFWGVWFGFVKRAVKFPNIVGYINQNF